MKAKSSAEKDEYKAALCWHISSCIFGFFHRAARPVSEMKRSAVILMRRKNELLKDFNRFI
jgi:hypothetical protein